MSDMGWGNPDKYDGKYLGWEICFGQKNQIFIRNMFLPIDMCATYSGTRQMGSRPERVLGSERVSICAKSYVLRQEVLP